MAKLSELFGILKGCREPETCTFEKHMASGYVYYECSHCHVATSEKRDYCSTCGFKVVN